MKIEERVEQLERQVKELLCTHDMKFDCCVEKQSHYTAGLIVYQCRHCTFKKKVRWERIPKKQQQALLELNLVPSYWPVTDNNKRKGDK